MYTKPVIATTENIAELQARFSEFIDNNSLQDFEHKAVWGEPKENEDWEGFPRNRNFFSTPKIGEFANPYSEVLPGSFSLQLTSEEDVKSFLFANDEKCYQEYYPQGVDPNQRTFNLEVVVPGDRIYFEEDGIVVIPKKKRKSQDQILSWKLCIV